MSIIDTLIEKFPVRKSKQQKQAFREWVVEQSEAMGYHAAADEKGFSRNVVIGDPEQAEVVFTAHYDTQPVLPFPNFITPTSIGLYLAYQLLLTVGFAAAGLAAGALMMWITG